MPYTYPPQQYEDLTGGLQYRAFREFGWFINGTHPSQANTVPWLCVDCYDNVTRVQPTGGLMSNLPAGNRWKPGDPAPTALTANAWAVFQAPASDVTERFSFLMKGTGGETSVTLTTNMFWLNNFVPAGGGADSSPTLPTVQSQVISPTFGSTSDFRWNLILDEGTIMFTATPESISAPAWFYLGEVQSINPESLDPRPFVISNSWTRDGWNIGFNSNYRGISAVTNLVMNVLGEVTLGVAQDYPGSTAQDAFASLPLSNVSFHGNTTGSRYSIGFGRNTGALSKQAGSASNKDRNTAGYVASDKRFLFWSRFNLTDPLVVALYSRGTTLDDHTLVQETSVPDQLIPSVGGGGETTPPVVVYINPIPGTEIRSNTAITVNVTDDSGLFAGIQLRVSFPSARPVHPTEAIHSGDRLGVFEPFYQGCTVKTITDGFQFVLTRVNPDSKDSDTGWPGSPIFTATPVDTSGNAA